MINTMLLLLNILVPFFNHFIVKNNKDKKIYKNMIYKKIIFLDMHIFYE